MDLFVEMIGAWLKQANPRAAAILSLVLIAIIFGLFLLRYV